MTFHALRDSSKRSVPTIRRKKPNPYYSVEFSLKGLDTVHLFRLRETNSDHKCVLVREDSRMLSLLKVGDVLPLKLNFDNFCVDKIRQLTHKQRA